MGSEIIAPTQSMLLDAYLNRNQYEARQRQIGEQQVHSYSALVRQIDQEIEALTPFYFPAIFK